MIYTTVANPVYSRADHSAINCTVTFDDLGALPFTASSDDVEAHSVEIFNRAVAGEFGAVAAYVSPPAPVPETISDRQFFQALALQGTISQAEALAAVKTGTIPAVLQTAISSLTGNDAFNAEMLLSGATEFKRSHPLTVAIGAAQGMNPAQIDAFFQFAAGL
jgi:hypothetical protein